MTRDEWMNIGKTMRDARDAKGIKQKFVQDHIYKGVAALEKSDGFRHRLTIGYLKDLCEYYGLEYRGNIWSWCDLSNLPNELWLMRHHVGLTQEGLAERSGLSVNRISRLETGQCLATVHDLIALNEPLHLGLWEFDYDKDNI